MSAGAQLELISSNSQTIVSKALHSRRMILYNRVPLHAVMHVLDFDIHVTCIQAFILCIYSICCIRPLTSMSSYLAISSGTDHWRGTWKLSPDFLLLFTIRTNIVIYIKRIPCRNLLRKYLFIEQIFYAFKINLCPLSIDEIVISINKYKTKTST